jgi:dCTP deaminase
MIAAKHNVLSDEEIINRMRSKDPTRRLVITPMIDVSQQIKHSTIDLRLGNEFIISRRMKYSMLDPIHPEEVATSKMGEYQEKVYIGLSKSVILHPQQMALGSSLEYVQLPEDLIGYISGRSSWGRLGLVIATANVIHPNYKGVITLELVNSGDTPLPLYPGIRIAQLILHTATVSKHKEKLSRYTASTGPGFTRLFEDEEWSILRKIRKVDMQNDG